MALDSPPEQALAVPAYPIWRLSVTQYRDMIEAGILTEADPVEFLEGWLVTKMPKNPLHTLATQLASTQLAAVLPEGWFVNVQEPITTADSEPEPDVLVVRGQRRDYRERYPSPDDVALVVEVSDTTLVRDRTLKLRIYASARIPVYWIVNLPDQPLEVYSDPTGTGEAAAFASRKVCRAGEGVLLLLDGSEAARISVDALWE